MRTLTDNSNLRLKLLVRKYFLDKYHTSSPPKVLDCCMGAGDIWNTLKKEYTVKSYWGVDKKKRKGRLTIDSVRLLKSSKLDQDVIDVDTYGSPWKHWMALLPNIRKPISVFLTISYMGQTSMQPNAHGAEFVRFFPKSTPKVLKAKIMREIDLNYMLARTYDYGIMVVEGAEAVGGEMKYVGVRLVPGK